MLQKVHSHNLKTYGHPVAAFQKTIQGAADNSLEFDISPSAVLAHSLETGEPIQCEMKVGCFDEQGKMVGNQVIALEASPTLIDSHTVNLSFDVPEGLAVPHDHTIEYKLQAGDHTSTGLVSNFFSDVAEHEPRSFAPGVRHTLVGDMYDSDRYDEYRKSRMPIASLLVSGISTGKSPSDVLRVGGLDVVSSYDLPKNPADIRFQGVPSYLGDHGEYGAPVKVSARFDEEGQKKRPLPVGYTSLGVDGTQFVINMLVLDAFWKSQESVQGGTQLVDELNDPSVLPGLLPEATALKLQTMYEGRRMPSLADLLSHSSGLRIRHHNADEGYRRALAMLESGAYEGEFPDFLDEMLDNAAVIGSPGTVFHENASPVEVALLLVIFDMLVGEENDEATVLDKVRKGAKDLFDLDLWVEKGIQGQNIGITQQSWAWMGNSNLVTEFSQLDKLIQPVIGQSDFIRWVLSAFNFNVPLKADGMVAIGVRAVGTYWVSYQTNDELRQSEQIVFVTAGKNTIFTYPRTGKPHVIRNKSIRMVETYAPSKGKLSLMFRDVNSDSSAAASSSLTGGQRSDVVDRVFCSSRFAPEGHRALTLQDVLMARPNAEAASSSTSSKRAARSVDHLTEKVLVGALVPLTSVQPDVLEITPKQNMYEVRRNGALEGHAVYDPTLNQFRFSGDLVGGSITDFFDVDDHGVSFQGNYYSHDLDAAFPERAKMREIIDAAKAKPAEEASIEQEIFSARSEDSEEDAEDEQAWVDYSHLKQAPTEYAPESKIGARRGWGILGGVLGGAALGLGAAALATRPYGYGYGYGYPGYYGPYVGYSPWWWDAPYYGGYYYYPRGHRYYGRRIPRSAGIYGWRRAGRPRYGGRGGRRGGRR